MFKHRLDDNIFHFCWHVDETFDVLFLVVVEEIIGCSVNLLRQDVCSTFEPIVQASLHRNFTGYFTLEEVVWATHGRVICGLA